MNQQQASQHRGYPPDQCAICVHIEIAHGRITAPVERCGIAGCTCPGFVSKSRSADA